MTMNVIGYAAPYAKTELSPYNFVRRDPRADDVDVEIPYCGICHLDLHHVRGDWNNTTFPDVEVIKIKEVNEAYKRMLKSDVNYRFVIDMDSLKERG